MNLVQDYLNLQSNKFDCDSCYQTMHLFVLSLTIRNLNESSQIKIYSFLLKLFIKMNCSKDIERKLKFLLQKILLIISPPNRKKCVDMILMHIKEGNRSSVVSLQSVLSSNLLSVIDPDILSYFINKYPNNLIEKDFLVLLANFHLIESSPGSGSVLNFKSISQNYSNILLRSDSSIKKIIKTTDIFIKFTNLQINSYRDSKPTSYQFPYSFEHIYGLSYLTKSLVVYLSNNKSTMSGNVNLTQNITNIKSILIQSSLTLAELHRLFHLSYTSSITSMTNKVEGFDTNTNTNTNSCNSELYHLYELSLDSAESAISTLYGIANFNFNQQDFEVFHNFD